MAVPKFPDTSNRKVALVTGASRGIGRAIAIELARVNYDVMINYASNQAAANEASIAARAASTDKDVRVATCQANIGEPFAQGGDGAGAHLRVADPKQVVFHIVAGELTPRVELHAFAQIELYLLGVGADIPALGQHRLGLER